MSRCRVQVILSIYEFFLKSKLIHSKISQLAIGRLSGEAVHDLGPATRKPAAESRLDKFHGAACAKVTSATLDCKQGSNTCVECDILI